MELDKELLIYSLLSGFIGAVIGGACSIFASYLSTKSTNKKTDDITNRNINNIRKLEDDKLNIGLKLLAVKVVSYIKQFAISSITNIKSINLNLNLRAENVYRKQLLINDLFKLIINKHLSIKEMESIIQIMNYECNFYENQFKTRLKDKDSLILGLNLIFDNYEKIFEKGFNGHPDTIFRSEIQKLGLTNDFYEMLKKLQDFSGVKTIKQL